MLQRKVSNAIICPNYLAHMKASYVILLSCSNGFIFKIDDIFKIYHKLSNLSYFFFIF
jgi:hypothetical protein